LREKLLHFVKKVVLMILIVFLQAFEIN